MNKNDLKLKWSKYCDTDKLVDEVRAMYSKNRHSNSIHGICVMLDEFFTNKEPLIEMIVNSKNYIGNLRIAVQKEFERQISSSDVRAFFNSHRNQLSGNHLLKYEDEKGKTFFDYFNTGKKSFAVNDLSSAIDQVERKKLLDNFERYTRATKKSYDTLSYFNYFMEEFKYIAAANLPKTFDLEAENVPVLKRGTKTSRAFNTVCCHYGIDKLNPQTVTSTDANGNVTTRTVYPYNKLFAEYSDLVSDIARKMYFVISLNPLDYLTMSNGVSWKSCHNIWDGCYKGGVLSYMLDGTSFITFVVKDLSEPIYENPKFYRQMFHYSNEMFLQNRLYPQGNDGATNLYDKFRDFMIEEFSELLHTDGEWEVKKGRNECINHTNSIGQHYKDYHSNNSCGIFYPIASRNKLVNHVMTIGHDGICARCGKPYNHSGRLSHDEYDHDCTAE